MPIFIPGASKTAKTTVKNPTSQPYDYRVLLSMIGAGQVIEAETSFRLAAGELKVISIPMGMPWDDGIYQVYLTCFSAGVLLKQYQDVDVVIRRPSITLVDWYLPDSAAPGTVVNGWATYRVNEPEGLSWAKLGVWDYWGFKEQVISHSVGTYTVPIITTQPTNGWLYHRVQWWIQYSIEYAWTETIVREKQIYNPARL